MTPTTPEQAREAAELYRDTGTTVIVTMVFSLADQIEKLTKERDDYRLLGDAMVAGLKFERDEYTKARDALAVNHKKCVRCLGEALQDTTNLAVERDALMSAGKLALEVCLDMRRYGDQRGVAMAIGAEAALRRAGVQ